MRNGGGEVDVERTGFMAGCARLEELKGAIREALAAMRTIIFGELTLGLVLDTRLKLRQSCGKTIAILAHVPSLVARGLEDPRQKCRRIASIRLSGRSLGNALPRATC